MSSLRNTQHVQTPGGGKREADHLRRLLAGTDRARRAAAARITAVPESPLTAAEILERPEAVKRKHLLNAVAWEWGHESWPAFCEAFAALDGPIGVLYECGICSGYHPWIWDGDCRDDDNRYGGPEDYEERYGVTAEIRSMGDRRRADGSLTETPAEMIARGVSPCCEAPLQASSWADDDLECSACGQLARP